MMRSCSLDRTVLLVAVLTLALAGPGSSVLVAAEPAAQGSPAPTVPPVALEAQLAVVTRLFADKKLPEAFSEAERFLVVDDRPTAQRQESRRASLLLAKIDEIKKGLTQPAGSHDNALAQLLYSIAKAFENGKESAQAIKVYERIVAEYPKAVFEGESNEPVAKLASEQLAWHKEKHAWVQSDLATLQAKLREALTKHDAKALSALIARKGFWSGPFQSEGGPDDPDRVLKYLETSWPKKGSVDVAREPESFSDMERQVFQKTGGWTGQYPEIYLIVERVPGGWHWSAVAFALPPGHEVAEDSPSADPTPAVSPAPSPVK